MKVIYDSLYQKMSECGVTPKELAAVAGISVFSLWLKMRGFAQWKLHEVLCICVFFRVVDAEELFSN